MITQTIKVDLLNKIPSENIIFRQGEVGREIVFEVYNDDVAVDLDEYDVTFAIYKPDGNFVIVSGTVDNDTVTIEETEQMTAVCGLGYFDLKLTKTGEEIYTYNGFVEIDTPILTHEVIESVSEVNGYKFPQDFQEKLTAGENITIEDNVISADTAESVSITPMYESGVKIADYTIGETTNSLYIPFQTNYSIEIVDTGEKWIDGRKIYKKTFSATAPIAYDNNFSSKSLGTIPNLRDVIDLKGVAISNVNGDKVSLPYFTSNTNYTIKTLYSGSNGAFLIMTNTSHFSEAQCYITVYFTINE